MELEFVRWLTEQLATQPQVALGIGDDAAVVEVPESRQIVVAADMLTDGVHFEVCKHSPEQIGRKSLAVNLSDLAAMAATPLACVVSLNVPREQAKTTLPQQLMRGIAELATEFSCPIVGGDTNVTAGPLVVSVTVLGCVATDKFWTRSGAQVGDRLLVTGSLGGSISGHHLDFTPRVSEALALAAKVDIHAAMDISDGLSLDLSRMLEASGVGAIVDTPRVPITSAARDLAKTSGKTTLEHALNDGEDFELLLAVSPPVAEQLLQEQPLSCGLTDVGEITAERQLRQRDSEGKIRPLEARGFEHK